jgi:hypothetical protein
MKLLFVFALTSILLVSCRKEISLETITGGGGGGGGTPTYFIQAKVNGELRTFNFNNMAKVTDFGNGLKSLSLIGSATANASNLEGINLTINFFAGSPVAGTYSEDYSGTDYVTAGVYNPNSATIVYGAGLTVSTVSPLNITISKIDNAEATGTFKGAFYKTDISGGLPSTEYLEFTEGSFKLPVR